MAIAIQNHEVTMNIQWAYLRKGWKSCQNAQEVLETAKASIEETVDARKERIDEKAAWNLVKDAKSIVTAKGKKVSTWDPKKDDKGDILKHVMGPSGNLRAPMFRVDGKIIIGFNLDLYQQWVAGNWKPGTFDPDLRCESCS